MSFDDDEEDLRLSQIFCREMIARGVFMHPYHNWFLCAAHTEADIDHALDMADAAFELIRRECRNSL
jgi:glutamate-1-semialdehyde 2,1-aminomutase